MSPEPPSHRRGPKRVGNPGTLEVFGADEQTDHDISSGRYASLSRMVLVDEGIRGDVEFALLFVDRDVMTDLNRTHMGGSGPTDVLAFAAYADGQKYAAKMFFKEKIYNDDSGKAFSF